VISDRGDLFRYGKDDVEVLDVEKFGVTFLNPLGARQRLAFGAMAVAAGVIGIALMATLVALLEMTAQCRCAAHLDRAHDAPLRRGQRRAMLFSIDFSVVAENIRYFQAWPRQGLVSREAEADRRVATDPADW
jgi:hypothetical protein